MVPPSVGDCIAVTTILVNIINAAKNSKPDYNQAVKLREELNRMLKNLQRLKKEATALASVSGETGQVVQGSIAECKATIVDLDEFIGIKINSEYAIGRWWKRFMWSLTTKDDTTSYQEKLSICIDNLNMLQHELDRWTTRDESARLGTRLELMLSSRLDDAWYRNSIKFQDAKGNPFTIPLHLCQTFKDFADFLEFNFRNDRDVLALVARKHFWLFLPPRVYGDVSTLITEVDWEAVAFPGVRLVMSLYLEEDSRPDIGDTATRGRPQRGSSVHFVTPLPVWTELPETLEFRWMSEPPVSGPLGASTDHSGESSPGSKSSSSDEPFSEYLRCPLHRQRTRKDYDKLARSHLGCFFSRFTPSHISEHRRLREHVETHRLQEPQVIPPYPPPETSQENGRDHDTRARDKRARARAQNARLSRKLRPDVAEGLRTGNAVAVCPRMCGKPLSQIPGGESVIAVATDV